MTRSIVSALLAAVAFLPAVAQAQDPRDGEGRPERAERGQRGPSDGGGRFEQQRQMPVQAEDRTPQPTPPSQPQPQWRGQQGGASWASRNPDDRGDRAANGNTGDVPPEYRDGRAANGNGGIVPPSYRGDRTPGWNGNRQPDRTPGWDGNRQPDRSPGWNGNRQPDRNPGWNGNGGYDRSPGWSGNTANRGAWNRQWRGDNRYDWQNYRYGNRNAFRLPRYYSPRGWNYGYRRFGIGITLNALLFDRDYWIDDPYAYRLPPAYGPYRWVRYYNDALLVDVRSGYVVDTIYDIFW